MYKKIMVPLDGSDLAECVLPHVNALTRACSISELIFARVAEPGFIPGGAYSDGGAAVTEGEMDRIRQQEAHKARTDAEQYLASVLARESYPVYTGKIVLEGQVPDALVGYAERNGVDLIVISTHGRSGASRLVRGSVAESILRATCIPVLMVRAPGCFTGV